MPRGMPYVSPEQREQNERDAGDPDYDTPFGSTDDDEPESSVGSPPLAGGRRHRRSMPELPPTPGNDAAANNPTNPFL